MGIERKLAQPLNSFLCKVSQSSDHSAFEDVLALPQQALVKKSLFTQARETLRKPQCAFQKIRDDEVSNTKHGWQNGAE